MIKSIAIQFLPAKQVGLEVNTIILDLTGSRNCKSLELSSSNGPTQVTDSVTGSSRV